jgi:archaellum component FlaC
MKIFNLPLIFLSMVVIGANSFAEEHQDRRAINKIGSDINNLHCDFEQRKEQYANDNEKLEYLITEVKHLKSSITAISRSELSAVSHRFTKLEAAQ